MKSHLEILEDTLRIYGTNPKKRSVDSTRTCVYNGPDGEACAVARLIPKRKRLKLPEYPVRNNCVQSILPTSVRNLGVNFLESLQGVHDKNVNWSDPSNMIDSVVDVLNDCPNLPNEIHLFVGPFVE